MLARAGLGDDAGLAHAPGEQDLAQAIVDLVRAGVVEVFALQIDFRATQMRGQPLGEIERAFAADIMGQQARQFGLEQRILLRRLIGLFQRQHQRHQGFGDKAAAIGAEMAARIGTGAQGIGNLGHALCLAKGLPGRVDEGGDARPSF